MTQLAKTIKIRWMLHTDLEKIQEIEDASFLYPWDKHEFLSIFKQRNCIGLVATLDNTIVGYIVYEIFENNYEILNFVIKKQFRRRRFGTVLLNNLLRKLDLNKRTKVILKISETNLEAQMFFKKQNFLYTATLKNYYDEVDFDAYLMEYNL